MLGFLNIGKHFIKEKERKLPYGLKHLENACPKCKPLIQQMLKNEAELSVSYIFWLGIILGVYFAYTYVIA